MALFTSRLIEKSMSTSILSMLRKASELFILTRPPSMLRKARELCIQTHPRAQLNLFSGPLYIRFLNATGQQTFFSMDLNLDKPGLKPLPAYPADCISGSSVCVLNKTLYVMGGFHLVSGEHSSHIFCTEIGSKAFWAGPPMLTPRGRACAVAMENDGTLYVFGGCSKPWAEVYDRYSKVWSYISGDINSLPSWEGLCHSEKEFDTPPNPVAVSIWIYTRPYHGKGGIFNVEHWGCPSKFPERLIRHWHPTASSAFCGELIFTTYCNMHEEGQNPIHSIAAFDPVEEVWLCVHGIDPCFHHNASHCEIVKMVSTDSEFLILVYVEKWAGPPHHTLIIGIYKIGERKSGEINLIPERTFTIRPFDSHLILKGAWVG